MKYTSAAVVVKAAQDAAKSVVLRGGKVVTQAHLEQAVDEIRKSHPAVREA